MKKINKARNLESNTYSDNHRREECRLNLSDAQKDRIIDLTISGCESFLNDMISQGKDINKIDNEEGLSEIDKAVIKRMVTFSTYLAIAGGIYGTVMLIRKIA